MTDVSNQYRTHCGASDHSVGPCRRVAERFFAAGWTVARQNTQRGHLRAYVTEDPTSEICVYVVPTHEGHRASLVVERVGGLWVPWEDGPEEERRVCDLLGLSEADLWLRPSDVPLERWTPASPPTWADVSFRAAA